MVMTVFSFYNKMIGAYNSPVFQPLGRQQYVESIARATRAGMIKGPVDELELHYLGTFDDTKGVFELESRPQLDLILSTCVNRPVPAAPAKGEQNDGSGQEAAK